MEVFIVQEKIEKYIYYINDNKYRVKFLKVDKKSNIKINFDQYICGTLDDARKLRDDKLKENGLTLEKENNNIDLFDFSSDKKKIVSNEKKGKERKQEKITKYYSR